MSGQLQPTSGSLTDVHSGVWLSRIQSSSYCHETTVNSGRDPLYVLLVASAAQLHGMTYPTLSCNAFTVLLQVQSTEHIILLIHLIVITDFHAFNKN